MQISLTELLNLQVPACLSCSSAHVCVCHPCHRLNLRQEDVSQRRYVVKDVAAGDDGRTNDFGALRVTWQLQRQAFARSQPSNGIFRASHSSLSRSGVVTLDVTALDALQTLAHSHDV